jgi:hypothetical protein
VQTSRDHTALLTAVAMLAASLMVAQHIAGKATRDALFLTHFDVAQLPKVMMAGAGVSVAAVWLMSRLLPRYGPARLIAPLYLASALLLAVQWYLADAMPEVAAVALYLHVSALNSILISGFWSMINERFDPYAAKKMIAKLTAASTFGGLLGGVASATLASAADTQAILLMLSGMHLVCAAAVAMLARGQQRAARAGQRSGNLLAPLKRSPLIRRMALLALLVATTAAVLDYILKAEASAALSDQGLITFFSYFYMAVGLGTFLVQSAVGGKALRWLGLGGTMAAWPLAVLVTGAGALVFRSLVTATLMRASANLLYNSFFRSGFELLYTPIAPADKRTGKVLIDVGADRSGDLLGGMLVLAVLLIPVATESILLITALILAVICLTLILALHRGYVRQLADNLRSGSLRADKIKVVDATTAHTVAVTQPTMDRDQLLRDIASFRKSGAADPPTTDAAPRSVFADAVTEAIIDLRSGNETRIRRILASHAMTAELLPHVVPLLADGRLLRDALRSVRTLASSGAGQLADALLDPMQHPLVRRRLPLVLAHSDSPLAIQGLSVGLDDPDWNVRFRCAQGLEAIRRSHPHLKASEERLLAIAEAEARALSTADAGSQGPGGAGEPPSRMEWRDQRIQLLFLLLGALYEPETLELCLRALNSEDRELQGTALEYLENLLPPHIWALLHPVLAKGRTRAGKKRTLQQAARDLLGAASSLRAKRKRVDTDTDIVDGLD